MLRGSTWRRLWMRRASRLDALIGEAVEMAEIDANVVQVHAAPQHTRTLLEHAVEESHSALARTR